MRIHVLSDLHLEFPRCSFVAPPTDADVVVLAGDIHRHASGIEWAARSFPNQAVIYLAGNHEFYGGQWHGLDARLRRLAANAGIHYLEDDAVVLGGVRFVGATLWTDYLLFGAERAAASMAMALGVMLDYRLIDTSLGAPDSAGALPAYPEPVASPRWLTPADTVARHGVSRRALEARLAVPFAGPTVVVTHHLPSAHSVAARYRDDPVSAAFASNLDTLIETYAPALWIHGHTHDSFDYRLAKTRVVCNPRGYEARDGSLENRRFQADLLVTV